MGNGGALHSYAECSVIIARNFTVTLTDNRAQYGGAVFSMHHSDVLCFEDSKIKFYSIL